MFEMGVTRILEKCIGGAAAVSAAAAVKIAHMRMSREAKRMCWDANMRNAGDVFDAVKWNRLPAKIAEEASTCLAGMGLPPDTMAHNIYEFVAIQVSTMTSVAVGGSITVEIARKGAETAALMACAMAQAKSVRERVQALEEALKEHTTLHGEFMTRVHPNNVAHWVIQSAAGKQQGGFLLSAPVVFPNRLGFATIVNFAGEFNVNVLARVLASYQEKNAAPVETSTSLTFACKDARMRGGLPTATNVTATVRLYIITTGETGPVLGGAVELPGLDDEAIERILNPPPQSEGL